MLAHFVFNSLTLKSFVTKIAQKVVLSRTWFTENAQFTPDIGFFFPFFVLCLRDFNLNGMNDESTDHYFEKCLRMKKETDPKAKKYNALRLSVKQHFEHRSCFLFDRPAAGKKDLARLEELEEKELNQDFLNDTELQSVLHTMHAVEYQTRRSHLKGHPKLAYQLANKH